MNRLKHWVLVVEGQPRLECICGYTSWKHYFIREKARKKYLYKHIVDNTAHWHLPITEFDARDDEGHLAYTGIPGHRLTQMRHWLREQVWLVYCACGGQWPIVDMGADKPNRRFMGRGSIASKHRDEVVRELCGLKIETSS